MKVPLTRGDLSGMRCHCGKPECGPVYFHAACHHKTPPWCYYDPEGFITIVCSVCNKEVVRIAVAEDATSRSLAA
jgi:hypothetical protein